MDCANSLNVKRTWIFAACCTLTMFAPDASAQNRARSAPWAKVRRVADSTETGEPRLEVPAPGPDSGVRSSVEVVPTPLPDGSLPLPGAGTSGAQVPISHAPAIPPDLHATHQVTWWDAVVQNTMRHEQSVPVSINRLMPVSYTHLTLPTNREV